LAAPRRKKLVTLLKIVFSATLLYLIFTKLDFREIIDVFGAAHPVYLLLAVVLFVISKIFSAYRLNLYFHVLGVPLSQLSNLRLYLLGMFYNLFLPGGIGGDAYKGYVIRKQFETRTREVVSALVLDRLSGLLLLALYASMIALLAGHPALQPFKIYIGAGMFASVILFWYVSKKLFYFAHPVFWPSLGYSALVQLAQMICAYFILLALNVQHMQLIYLFVFLVSSIVAVLPLTLGGIGSRELVFFYGAVWLGLNEHTSVGVSMVFFLITAFVSLTGIKFHFKKPVLKLTGDG
jgi:uncharacterized membrane protein YbhN (UPF0104 family)